jgi:hypothetical protein
MAEFDAVCAMNVTLNARLSLGAARCVSFL